MAQWLHRTKRVPATVFLAAHPNYTLSLRTVHVHCACRLLWRKSVCIAASLSYENCFQSDALFNHFNTPELSYFSIFFLSIFHAFHMLALNLRITRSLHPFFFFGGSLCILHVHQHTAYKPSSYIERTQLTKMRLAKPCISSSSSRGRYYYVWLLAISTARLFLGKKKKQKEKKKKQNKKLSKIVIFLFGALLSPPLPLPSPSIRSFACKVENVHLANLIN